MYQAYNVSRKTILADKVVLSSKLWQRMKGLLGRNALVLGEGMWIFPCNSIHTFFMRFSIDVVFLSSQGVVIKTIENMSPFRISSIVIGAKSVLELSSGAIQHHKTTVGDILDIRG